MTFSNAPVRRALHQPPAAAAAVAAAAVCLSVIVEMEE